MTIEEIIIPMMLGVIIALTVSQAYPLVRELLQDNTRFFDCETVQKLKSGELRRGDILIRDYGESKFEYIILKNDRENGSVTYTLLHDMEQPEAYLEGKVPDELVYPAGTVGRPDTDSYSRINRRDMYRYRQMSQIHMKVHLSQDERVITHRREWPEVRMKRRP